VGGLTFAGYNMYLEQGLGAGWGLRLLFVRRPYARQICLAPLMRPLWISTETCALVRYTVWQAVKRHFLTYHEPCMFAPGWQIPARRIIFVRRRTCALTHIEHTSLDLQAELSLRHHFWCTISKTCCHFS
jgi:hypothetical protein